MPPAFADKDLFHACSIMRRHPFRSLGSNDDEGFPFLSHLSLYLVGPAESWCLLGHSARVNPHGHFPHARPEALSDWMDRLGLTGKDA
ncbi:MAG: FMN-binding negative transcriptional regulator [Hydrogenophaga sp.]|uniref:FMN-binding negative transcriptional regulator n=1 Tax=Hydrogenophaga sp. TaxID=1904254 RepID=UPI001BB96270|nr:FMN-binding negative transcriptional regulator [Hydrogenophaga sp.]